MVEYEGATRCYLNHLRHQQRDLLVNLVDMMSTRGKRGLVVSLKSFDEFLIMNRSRSTDLDEFLITEPAAEYCHVQVKYAISSSRYQNGNKEPVKTRLHASTNSGPGHSKVLRKDNIIT